MELTGMFLSDAEKYGYHILTDEELEEIHSGYSIVDITWRETGNSGWLVLEKDEETISDSFIFYSSGKIAFDRWYPEKEYLRLCDELRKARIANFGGC